MAGRFADQGEVVECGIDLPFILAELFIIQVLRVSNGFLGGVYNIVQSNTP